MVQDESEMQKASDLDKFNPLEKDQLSENFLALRLIPWEGNEGWS